MKRELQKNEHRLNIKKLCIINQKPANGITLIALVITIIVLLILAGVTVAMLVGENGILNNARSANVNNIYYSAEEQVKLAYMAVKTEIMTQKAADSKYDASTKENTIKLGNLVLKDLVGKSLEFETNATDNNLVKGDSNYIVDVKSEGTILITYKNNAIVAGEISEGKPAQNGKIEYKIVFNDQDALLNTDTGYSKDVEEKLAVDTMAHTTPWVQFEGDNQKYRVLYDANSAYGIELISSNIMGNVTLGKNDSAGDENVNAGDKGSVTRAIWSYHNAIETLNKAAETIINISTDMVDSVRCVGSRPYNKNFRITEKYSDTLTPNSNTYFSNLDPKVQPYTAVKDIRDYNGLWEQGEAVFGSRENPQYVKENFNYKADIEQMEKLGIKISEEKYWLASRIIDASPYSTNIGVEYFDDEIKYISLFHVINYRIVRTGPR